MPREMLASLIIKKLRRPLRVIIHGEASYSHISRGIGEPDQLLLAIAALASQLRRVY